LGRHSSGERGSYVRSVLGWILPWVVLAVIVGAAVWFAVGAVSGDAGRVQNTSSDTNPTPTPTDPPSPTPTELPSPTEEPTEPADGGAKLITKGVTVQVLNGTGGIANAAANMADRLARLGFRIFAIQTGLTTDETVVYFTGEEDREAAEALARRFGWAFGPSPASLSGDVDLHVVVSPADA
jgi:LytR cell envelope-related transcriptional attenuator